MKRKFSKILGVGLALSLLASLLLAGAPVLADVSEPTVALDEEEISVAEEYVISFVLGEQLDEADQTITVRFPEDTDVPDGALDTDSFDVAASPGWIDGVWDTTPVVTGLIDAGSAVGDEDDLTVIFTLEAGDKIGEGATVRIEFLQAGTTQIMNPTEPGTYTLEVQTSEEDDYVESEEYDIDAPDVGGSVHVYNPSDILLATYGGSDALIDAEDDDHFDGEDYTIEVGEGTYDLSEAINITGEGLTLVSTGGAEDTIIDADGPGIIITGDEVTVDGFTIDDGDVAVSIDAEEVTLTNCVITDADIGVEIDDGAITDVEVSNNVIEDCADGIVFVDGGGDLDDCDITGNEITEASNDGGIVFLGDNDDIDIKNNTITGNEVAGIYFDAGGAACNNIDIKGNTISENEADGIWIDTANAPTDLVITGNTIADNEDAGLNVDSWTDEDCVFMFNDIYDNDDNIDTEDDMTNAIFNWWGADDDDDIEDTITGTGDVEFEPWLTGLMESVSAGSEIEVGDGGLDDDGDPIDPVTSLDGRDDASVNVSGIRDDAGAGADIISAFKYMANPQDDIDDAIAFYDVFMIINDDVDLGDVSGKLKFYDSAIDEGSVASFWTGDFWAECSDQLARDGVVYVDLTEDTVPSFDELDETAFVVVAGEEEEALGVPTLLAPEVGADEVSLRPAFAWSAVEDAEFYCFQLADNPDFVVPLVVRDDDMSSLTTTAYGYKPGLDYSTSYYWRVKAVSGTWTFKSKGRSWWTEDGGWITGVFTTMAEPVEEAPPVVVEEAAPAPEITIEPIVEVITPPATPITPQWIYVIIGVGAVLVIALIVLIVRTRRVA